MLSFSLPRDAAFHARFGEHSISYEWRDAHRDELLANWERLHRGQSPVAIAPLD